MIRPVLILSTFIGIITSQGGGMAELKAITGDAPYSGTGNVPAPVPVPMGFWGRPRYSPMGFGSNPYWGYDGLYGSRFTSVGHSPYGELGPARYRPDDTLFSAMMSFFDGASSPFASRPANPRRFTYNSPRPSSLPSTSHVQSGDAFSLSSGGLGGFYKGSGN